MNIVGKGFVGNTIAHLCDSNNIKYNVFDPKIKTAKAFRNIKQLVNASEILNEWNYYFICVPTPAEANGSCDLSIVSSAIEEIRKNSTRKTVVVIRSTIVPKTCRKFHDTYSGINFTIIFCPEFLREKTANDDAYNAKFLLLGSHNNEVSPEIVNFFKKMYAHNNDISIIVKTYEMCEIFKYTLNTYFATKITFFNEIFELCETIDVEYNELKELFSLDNRVGDYGTIVPGPGNEFYGFHLKCLPKEVLGMIDLRKKLGLSSELMTCIDKRNNYFKNKQVKK